MKDKLFIASYTFVIFIIGILAGVGINLQVPEPKPCPQALEMEVERLLCKTEKIDLLIRTRVALTGKVNP